ncbi:MAG: cysteine hydrolase [Micrococcales bacterium]|nr:cysteine hydrolase [Micrococcales bacterium]
MTDIPASAVAVVIVDMQNGFCHPNGSFAQVGADVSGTQAAIPGCVRLVDAARQAGVPVFFTRAIHQPGLTDWKVLSELPMFAGLKQIGSCEPGTWDAQLVDELTVAPGERVIDKSRFSPFVETGIETQLHELGIENLVVGGVGTSACVESTVRDAAQREFRTFVAADACGDLSAEAHQNSIQIMGSMFGWATTTDEVLAAWN